MSSSGADASASDQLDAALARLSGPDLVAHLRATCRRADYDAAARVLGARDRRLAEAEHAAAKAGAGLEELGAKVQALEERCLAYMAKQRQSQSRGPSSGAIAAAAPRVDRSAEEPGPVIDLCSSDEEEEEELEEGEFRPPGVAAGVSCERKEEEAASVGHEALRAGVSCQQKKSAASERKEPASKGDEARRAGVSFERKESAASKAGEGRRAGVPCERKESAASEGEERTPAAGVSCKRKAPASGSSPDDEDDKVLLSKLFMKKKQRRRAQPGANGEPKKAHADVLANSAGAGPLGVDRPAISPVNRGIPEAVPESRDDPNVAVSVQGTGSGRSGKNGGLSRTMPSPPPAGSTARISSHKNGSEGEVRNGEKQGPVAGPENDAPIQVRTPRATDTVRRIVGSARVGAETPMELKNSSTDGTINMVLKSIEGQEKSIGGMHKTKGLLETNGAVGKASMVLRDAREQGKPDDQVVNTKVLSRTDGIRGQGGKLSPYTHGGRPTTTDKPLSATLQRKNQLALHSEQMSVESSLPTAVTKHWKSSSDVLNSCLRDKELCMQAVCALHRQKKFTTQPTAGGISKFDAHRVVALVEFLLDGNLQGRLKRTAEDLEKHDSTGHDFVERIVLQCSEQLFSIYRNKDDKYFR